MKDYTYENVKKDYSDSDDDYSWNEDKELEVDEFNYFNSKFDNVYAPT